MPRKKCPGVRLASRRRLRPFPGRLRVCTVVERAAPTRPTWLLPDALPDAVERHRGWLAPHFLDDRGRFLQSIHTFVVTGLAMWWCVWQDEPHRRVDTGERGHEQKRVAERGVLEPVGQPAVHRNGAAADQDAEQQRHGRPTPAAGPRPAESQEADERVEVRAADEELAPADTDGRERVDRLVDQLA